MIEYSVITPVFNRADCLYRCLESVTKNIQGREDIEHLVIDDGSTDTTPIIMKEYAKKHPHVHCLFFPKNRGTNAARNAAIAVAKGRFCIILDSDDYWYDSAISIIDNTVSAHPNIRHFCFAPDDMQSVYEHMPILAGIQQCILTFDDFLVGRVIGDFVHVMTTDIIKRHPFDEKLRIYEGVFFLAFYKEANKILFTNKIVSHRERGRSDSVTRDVIRTNKSTILRTLKAEKLTKYSVDLIKSEEGLACLHQHRMVQLDNYLLLSDYNKAREIIDEISKSFLSVIPPKYLWIYRMRMGWLYFCLLNLYLRIKYNILHKRIK